MASVIHGILLYFFLAILDTHAKAIRISITAVTQQGKVASS